MSPVVVRKFAKRKLLWVLTLVVVVFSVNVCASEETTTPAESETQTESQTHYPAEKRSGDEGPDTMEHRMLGDDINISLEIPESHRLVINGEVSSSGRSSGNEDSATEATVKAEESKPAPTFTRWKYKPTFRHGRNKPKSHDNKDMKTSSSNKVDHIEQERSAFPDDFFGPNPAPNGIGKKHEESKLTPANDRAYGKFGRLWKKRPFIPLVKQTTIIRPLHDHGGRGWGWRRPRHGRRPHGRRHPRFRHQRPKRVRHGKRPHHHHHGHHHGHGRGWGHRASKQITGSKYHGWEKNEIDHHPSMPSYAPAYISYGPFYSLPPGIKLENPVYVAPATSATQPHQYQKFPGLQHMDTPLVKEPPKKPFGSLGSYDHFEGDYSSHDHRHHDHSHHDHPHHDHSHHHHDDHHPHHHDHSHHEHSHHHHHSPNSIEPHSHHHDNHEHFTHNRHKKRRPLNKHIQYRRPIAPPREPEHHHHHDEIRPVSHHQEEIRPPPHHHHEDSPHQHHAHHSHETPAYHDDSDHHHHHHHENEYHDNHHHSRPDTPSIPNPGYTDSPPPSFYNRDNSFNTEGPLNQRVNQDSPNMPGYGTPDAAKNYEPPMNFGHPMHNFGPPMSSFGQPPPTFGAPNTPEDSPGGVRDGYSPGLPKGYNLEKPATSYTSHTSHDDNHLHGNKEFIPQNFFDTSNKHLESSSNTFDNKGGQRPRDILNQNNNPPKMSGIREEDKYYFNHDSDRGLTSPVPPLPAYEENNPFNGKDFDFNPSKIIDPFPPRAPQRPPPRFNTNYNSPGMSKDNKVTDWFHFAKRNRQEKILMGYPLEEKRKSVKFSTLPEPFKPFNPDPRHRHIPKLTYDNMSKRIAYRRRPGAGKRPRHRDLLTKDTEDMQLNSNASQDEHEQHEQPNENHNPHEEEFNNNVNAETEVSETHHAASGDDDIPLTLKSERGFKDMIKAHMKLME